MKTTIISRLTRRRVISFMSGTVAVTLLGCVRKLSSSVASTPQFAQSPSTQPSTSISPTCVVKPQQTEGPYFVDEKLNRSDIRSDPSTGMVKAGTPLRLVIQVLQVGDRTCTPLRNANVDIWHCDAEGIYSDVSDRRFNTAGQKFLRGYQVTNENGMVEFTTIYPGWYPGRTVHIHFKIRTNSATQPTYEFTSQLYFDDTLTDQIQAQAPYATRGQRTQRNDQDGIFRDGGEQLIVAVTPSETGYVGKFEIGLELT